MKSLSGAYDNLIDEKDPKPSDKEIESYFEARFPDYAVDIKPFVDAIKWVRSADWKSGAFLDTKDDLTIYQVLSFFLLSVYKVN